MTRPAKRVSLVTKSTIAKINGLFAIKAGAVLAISGTTMNSVIKLT